MATVTVTIGSYLGTDPMGPETWNDFKLETTAAVRVRAEAVFTTAEGDGGWTDETTGTYVPETAYVVVAAVPDDRIDGLAARLAQLADEFGQDAIALGVGQTTFVAADRVRAH